MTTKWHVLALGLAAWVTFSAGMIQAQQFIFPVPAEILVTRDADVFIFSSNPFQDPMSVCEFEFPIGILTAIRGSFPSIGDFGTIESDGSLMVDRSSFLAALDSRDALFALFCTTCGSNTGVNAAKALRASIGALEDGESVTLHTLYFATAPCSGDV